MVPEGWKLSTIDEISIVSSGGTPSRKNDSYWGGKIPWVTTAEVQYKVIEDTAEKITEEGLANSSAKLFPRGTILMAMYGQGKTRGQVGVLGVEAATNQACAAIILRPGYEMNYYYQYLISQYDNIREMANSGSQENLSAGIVKSIQVPVPPFPEQKKIAQVLSTWDKAITTTEQLLANSQQQKKALMQQLLTGKKRLLDGNGVRFSGEWKATKIGDLLKESRIPSKVNDPTKRLTVRLNLKGIEARESRGTEAVESTAHFVRAAGQFIYGKQNIHKGAFGIIPEDLDAYESSQDLPAFDFTGICDSIWFYHYITQENFFTSLEDKMSGTGSKRLNPKSFFKIKIVCPSIDEQKKIAAVLNVADQGIEHLKQKIEFLKQEKKSLMQQLLMGQRRVKIN